MFILTTTAATAAAIVSVDINAIACWLVGSLLLVLSEHLGHEESVRFRDALRGLCRSLHVGDADLLAEARGCRVVHAALALAVDLVADKDGGHVGADVLLQLVEPVADLLEGGVVGDIEHDHDAVGAAIVAGGDGPEALLAGSIPHLELDVLLVDLHVVDLEVDADGGDEVCIKLVVHETRQQCALADTALADHQNLELVIRL